MARSRHEMRERAKRRLPHPVSQFGAYLKACRERAGFRSQRAVVRDLGRRRVKFSQGLLAHYETGRVQDPSTDVLAALASLYGVDFFGMMLRLAKAKFDTALGEEAPETSARWALVEAALTPAARIGRASGLEADQVRSRAALLREVQILDVEGIANWQRAVEGLESFWVIAPYFLDDEDERMLRAVVDNLKRGVRYTYFIHRDTEARFEAFRERLASEGGSRVKVEKLAQALWIPPGAFTWLHADYVVADPKARSRAVGFLNLRHHGKTRFALRLPDPDLLELIDRVTAWMATVEARS